MLAGDFNFPREIVAWISTDDGVIGDFKEGNTSQKKAYRQLNELAVDFDLEQIVSKPTRKSAVLDLIYSNKAEKISQPNNEILDPISDHNLVSCIVETPSLPEAETSQAEENRPEISKYNLKNRDVEKFSEALRDMD